MLRTPEGTTPKTAVLDTLGPTLEWIVIYNASNTDTVAEITNYYENKAPTRFNFPVPARSMRSWGGHRTGVPDEHMPMGKLYGVRVRSPEPIIVQATRAEQEHGVRPPAAMPGRSFLSRLGHPGPLGKPETAWAYADCVIQRTNPLAMEIEWLTVLNPNPGKDAHIKVTFNYGPKPVTHEFTVGAERVVSVPLEKLEQVPEHRGAGVIVRSDVPVVVDQVRRYWYREHVAPAGTWIVTGYPVGDLDLP